MNAQSDPKLGDNAGGVGELCRLEHATMKALGSMRPAAAAAGRKVFLKVPMSIRGVRMAVGKQGGTER